VREYRLAGRSIASCASPARRIDPKGVTPDTAFEESWHASPTPRPEKHVHAPSSDAPSFDIRGEGRLEKHPHRTGPPSCQGARTGPLQCRNLKSGIPVATTDFLSMPPQPTPPILMRYEIRYCVV
jgi:hypothetical protein